MIQLTKESAYLLGALRDGSVCRFVDQQGKVHHSLAIYNKSLTWLNLLKEKFQTVFNKEPTLMLPKNRTPFVRIYSKEIVETLKTEYQHPIGKQISWDIPFQIKSGDIEILKHYIAGFWDAEGGVDLQNKETKFYLSWDGKTCPPLEFVKVILERNFGISSGTIGGYDNQNGVYPRFVLRVKKRDTGKFLELVPVIHPEKRAKLISITGG